MTLVAELEAERGETPRTGVAEKNTPFWWEEAPVRPLPRQPLAKTLDVPHMFFDLVQHGVGVCAIDDIAISVLASVIGAQPEKGWVLVDAGWMALWRDRGTANQQFDQGYGVVCEEKGRVLEDVVVSQVSQEHGILAMRMAPMQIHALVVQK
jgi:hypothetical protein